MVLSRGGFLSKKKKPVPAGKFNAGQKMYFWFATVGGGVMAYSGYVIWGMGGDVDTVRLYTIIHNFLGMVILAFFLTHIYMAVFAIVGSLESMKTGYKSKRMRWILSTVAITTDCVVAISELRLFPHHQR